MAAKLRVTAILQLFIAATRSLAVMKFYFQSIAFPRPILFVKNSRRTLAGF